MNLNPFFGMGRSANIGGGVGDALGSLTNRTISGLADFLPKELGDTLAKGLKNSNLGKVFGDAFENILLASKYQQLIDTLKQTGEAVSKSWEKADQAAFNYGKRIGLTSTQVKALRNDILNLSEAGAQFGIRYGKSLDEVIKLQTDFSAELGRNIKLTNSQLKDIAALSAVVGDEMAVKFSAQLENFGMSTTQAGELMTQMFNKSVKQGISLETYAKNVGDNLHLAQQYTFKRGVDGLTAMAEQAAKMKMDMQQVISLANKLDSIESAVNMSAELQVLGGPFSQFADPMALLHGSMLDMEDLSDRLTNLVGQIGFFNKNTGQIDIGAFERLRLKSAAASMGVDYGKLVESATQQAKRKEIEAQMSGLANIPEQYRELIMNTAQFQNGVAGIRGANGEFKGLSSLNGKDLRLLADFAKSDSENIRDIATMLRGMTDIREGVEKEKENERAVMYRNQSETIKGIYDKVGQSAESLQQLVKIELSNVVANSVMKPVENLGGKLVELAMTAVTKKEKGGIIRTHSEGDVITNGTPGREYILNSAQHGEFIVNKQSTAHHLGLLRAINADKGGKLQIAKHDEGGVIGNNSGNALSSLNYYGLMTQYQLTSSLKKGLNNLYTGSKGYINLQNKLSSSLTDINKMKTDIASKQLKLNRAQDIMRRNAPGSKLHLQSKYLSDKLSKEIDGINKNLNMSNRNFDRMVKIQDKIIGKEIRLTKIVNGSMSALAGVSAGINSLQGYKSDGTMILNKGKAVGGTIGSTIGATAGAALGSLAGPIGMMIGGAVGEFAGKAIGETIGKGSTSRRGSKRIEFANELDGRASNVFMGIKGDFSTSEMRKIKDKMKDGNLREYELDKNLVEKLKQTGNADIFTKKFKRGGLLKGRSHENGGILLNEAEGGEFIINKNSTAKSMGLLNKINNGNINDSNIKPIEPMGKQMKVKESQSYNNPSNQTMKMEPIDININGTIKLDTGDKTFDISKELFNNPTLINKLTDIITKQINIDEHGAFSRKDYRRRYSSV